MIQPQDIYNKRNRQSSLSLVNLDALKIENGSQSDSDQSSSTAGKRNSKARALVQHNYHDHAKAVNDSKKLVVTRGGVATVFPVKLFHLLTSTEADGLTDIVGWQPHGRSFVVRKPKEFSDLVLPKYFGKMKFSSFQRQLNLYGFLRLSRGQDKGGYYHEMFLRGRAFLCYRIQRMRVKGTGSRAASNPSAEPDFYSMESVTELEDHQDNVQAEQMEPVDYSSSSDEEVDMDLLREILLDEDDNSSDTSCLQDFSSSFSSLCSEDSASVEPTGMDVVLQQPCMPQVSVSVAPLPTQPLPFPSKPPQLDIEEMCFLQSLFGAKDVDKESSFGGNANNATSAFYASSNDGRPRRGIARTLSSRAA